MTLSRTLAQTGEVRVMSGGGFIKAEVNISGGVCLQRSTGECFAPASSTRNFTTATRPYKGGVFKTSPHREPCAWALARQARENVLAVLSMRACVQPHNRLSTPRELILGLSRSMLCSVTAYAPRLLQGVSPCACRSRPSLHQRLGLRERASARAGLWMRPQSSPSVSSVLSH